MSLRSFCLVGCFDGLSSANGRVDLDALSKTNALVTLSYTASLESPSKIKMCNE